MAGTSAWNSRRNGSTQVGISFQGCVGGIRDRQRLSPWSHEGDLEAVRALVGRGEGIVGWQPGLEVAAAEVNGP